VESTEQMTAAEVAKVLNSVTVQFPETVTQQGTSEKSGKTAYFVCDEWECTGTEQTTVHCTCKKGHWVNK